MLCFTMFLFSLLLTIKFIAEPMAMIKSPEETILTRKNFKLAYGNLKVVLSKYTNVKAANIISVAHIIAVSYTHLTLPTTPYV